jgi:hypothetical protein
MSDLLPELQFHSHDRVALSLSLILGLSIAGGVGILESQNHSHEGRGHTVVAAGHRPHDHAAVTPKEHADVLATGDQGAREMRHDHAD